MLVHKPILIYDIETDSLDIENANMKWFGAYSYLDDEYYLMPFKGNEKDIQNLISRHRVFVGFNNKEFDNPIIQNNFRNPGIFGYNTIIDLLEISAPKGVGYGSNRKNRLAQMGIKLKKFTLKNIVNELKLDDSGKEDIDYTIFQKDDWNLHEFIEIKKYLKQDIVITKKLFEWFDAQFSPLKKFLPLRNQENFLYLRSSLSVLAYNIICNKAGLEPVFGDKIKTEPYAGGHHIESRWNFVKGNIIEVDFTSAYPHAIMMCNLHSFVGENDNGWTGDGFYNVKGRYNNKEQGRVEQALKEIFLERLKAKKAGEKEKDKSYKIIINSHYGTSANPVFKSIYNPYTASDCTSIVRTWMKKLAKTLEESGFTCLYGFTDSIFVLLPKDSTKDDLIFYINKFLQEAKSHVPFPMDTFKMSIEEEIKMIYFVSKNCYLFVTKDNEIKYRSTLFNTNTPQAVLKLFNEYMKPIILQTLEIKFTKEELEKEMKKILEQNPELSAQEYKVTDLENYKVKTSLQYQICEKYGTGRHFLIPNKKNIGIGMKKSTKKKVGLRYCTIDEFKNNGLKISDIDMSHLMKHLKPLYRMNEIDLKEKQVVLIKDEKI